MVPFFDPECMWPKNKIGWVWKERGGKALSICPGTVGFLEGQNPDAVAKYFTRIMDQCVSNPIRQKIFPVSVSVENAYLKWKEKRPKIPVGVVYQTKVSNESPSDKLHPRNYRERGGFNEGVIKDKCSWKNTKTNNLILTSNILQPNNGCASSLIFGNLTGGKGFNTKKGGNSP